MEHRRDVENVSKGDKDRSPDRSPSGTAAGPPGAARRVVPKRFEGLDAYRGIAALLIVVFHVYQYSREATGAAAYVYEGAPWHTLFRGFDVTGWFFVLSGFLIFLPFASAAIEAGPAQPVRSFLIRRVIRIVPVYYAAIILVWAWRYSGYPGQWADLLQHLTFTQVFSREHIFWTIGPSWALAIIVQFYVFVALVGPLAHRACGRLRRPQDRAMLLAGGVALLFLLSAGYKWWAFYVADISKTDWPVYFGPLANLDNFAVGMLLAVAAAVGHLEISRPAPSLLVLAGAAVMAATAALAPNELVSLYFRTLYSLAFALILAATVLDPRGSPLLRVLRFYPLRYLGLISYGIFLWHEPILMELGKRHLLISPAPEAFPQNAVILISLSIAAAAVSYALIERPAANLTYLFTKEGRLAERFWPKQRS